MVKIKLRQQKYRMELDQHRYLHSQNQQVVKQEDRTVEQQMLQYLEERDKAKEDAEINKKEMLKKMTASNVHLSFQDQMRTDQENRDKMRMEQERFRD